MDTQTTFIETHPQTIQKSLRKGKPNINVPVRNQIEFKIASLDDLIDHDHTVRLVWDYVQRLDLSSILGAIQSIKGSVGRPATDPKILLALWLYATLDGIISARMIAEFCKEHIAYQWLCGGVNINHHTLSDFATKYGDEFEDFLTQSIAILMKQGWVDLEEVAQDGIRVRAHAGSASFKKEKKLEELYLEAKSYFEMLKMEAKNNRNDSRSKKAAAQLRARKEREQKLQAALEQLKKMKEDKKKSSKGKPKPEELERMKASTTDCTARKMKMPDGGFRPAYNIQFASSQKGQAIISLEVTNTGNDKGMIVSMIEKVSQKFNKVPRRWLVDAGFNDTEEIIKAYEKWKDCELYMPPIVWKKVTDPYEILPKDKMGVIQWKERMKSKEGKEVYKRRSCIAEFSNAQTRNYGMKQLIVRGIKHVTAVAHRFALAHNMQRFFTLSRAI